MMAPGESPEELKLWCDSMIRKSGCNLEQVWVMNDFVEAENGTAVYSFVITSLAVSWTLFVKKGRSHHQATQFLRLLGDATHDKTCQRLKK